MIIKVACKNPNIIYENLIGKYDLQKVLQIKTVFIEIYIQRIFTINHKIN